MRLFVAEKPSLARAIAEALPTPHLRRAHHIECGAGDIVAWCAGHILEPAPPQAYGDFKSWRLEHLPITPASWKLDVSAPDLLRSIRTLLARATCVVHAGDPDREGQLLVDEVLHFLGYRGPVRRLLVRDLSPEAVRTQLGALEDNEKYRPLHDAALARQRADWLYGMNMTRLYTLLGRASGYDGVLSVGRVQTPLLGLIVARDATIEHFVPVPYYAVSATVKAPAADAFPASWSPGSSAGEHLDGEMRLVSKTLADDIRRRVEQKTGSVVTCTRVPKSEGAPLPYALADLQMDAGRRLGLSAQEVLDVCQSLYETHRLLTYPRSDCSYLPEGHHAQGRDVLSAIAKHAPSLAEAAARADLSTRSKAWNDRKVTAHHAIVPTPNRGSTTPTLSIRERAIYELAVARYLAQFYPPYEYVQTRIELEVAGERFTATGRESVSPGWKVLARGLARASSAARDEEKDATKDTGPLPHLAPGDLLAVVEVAVAEKKTEPPRRFTDASLIEAMCSVAKFVTNPAVQKILTEADGIGTPATRAAIIETLFERGYVVRTQKSIVSTETGRALIRALPAVATQPDMTAVWEAAMHAIAERSQTLDAFLARVCAQLGDLVAQGRAVGRISVPQGARASATTPAPVARRKRASSAPKRAPRT
jgi:DNA topoisomerase-3